MTPEELEEIECLHAHLSCEGCILLAKEVHSLWAENDKLREGLKSWNDSIPDKLKSAEADTLRLHKDKMRLWNRNYELEAELVHARDAIASTDIEAFGSVEATQECPGWPIRDELIDRLNKVIPKPESE